MPSTKTHRNQLNKYKVNLSVKTAIKSSITKLRESIQKDDNSEEVNKLFKENLKEIKILREVKPKKFKFYRIDTLFSNLKKGELFFLKTFPSLILFFETSF